MNLLKQATTLVAYTQQLLSQNSSLITAQAEAALQIADLQQKIALALSQDAADKEAVQSAQDAADAAKKQADEIRVAADKASVEVVGLQQQVADMIKANAEVFDTISSVAIPDAPSTFPTPTPVPVEAPVEVTPPVEPVEVLPDDVIPTVPPILI